jgi:hypothetical protein
MMIAKATKEDGTEILILGITRKNLERLVERKPICLRRKTHGEAIPAGFEIVLFFGEDELAMQAEMQTAGAIGPHTKVNIDPRLKDP